MSKNKHLSVLVALGLLAGPMAVHGAYEYESISYPGSESDQVFGINNRGDVAGIGTIAPNKIPYVYNIKKRTFTDVSPVSGYQFTSVLGISDKGVLAGHVSDGSTDSGLIINKKGKVTVFDHPDALTATRARGVNNKGMVSGFRDDPNDQFSLPDNGFIYDSKKGTFIDIVPSLFTIAHGINNRGEVVGSATFNGDFDVPDPCGSNEGFVRRGWLRTKGGTVTYFIVNGGRTSARGISDSGVIAGFVTDPFSGLDKGFVVELDGSQCQSFTIDEADLLHFPGADATYPSGIKNSGEVIGNYFVGSKQVGFIARPQ